MLPGPRPPCHTERPAFHSEAVSGGHGVVGITTGVSVTAYVPPAVAV